MPDSLKSVREPVEVTIDVVKVQKRAGGNFMVTVPATAVKDLGVKGYERVTVLFNKDSRRVIYEFPAK